MDIKRIIWDEEKTNRLYDFEATNRDEKNFFGYQVGGAIVHFCDFFVKNVKEKCVLDYGSGMGNIIDCFLKKGAFTYGVDMSEEEVKEVNSRYTEIPNFRGVKVYDGKHLPFEDDKFDLITCTECIEHILDKHIDNVMTELYRVLKPGGIILFTTPNEEVISKNEICCPECNTIFHRWGHVRVFSKTTLAELLTKYGFNMIMCDTTDFRFIQRYLSCPSILDLSLRQLKYRLEMASISLKDKMTGRVNSIEGQRFIKYMELKRKPHLFFVGRK